jgi:uncharacterized protein YcbK (DUF882 family)
VHQVWHPHSCNVKKDGAGLLRYDTRRMSALSFIARRAGGSAAAALAAASMITVEALADVSHVVGRGHTIEAIAHRYHVTVKSIVDANHLKDPRHLKIGETLIVPGVTAKGKGAASGVTGQKPLPNATYAMRPKTPGVVHATRLATNEDFAIRVSTRHGHPSPLALSGFERLLRSGGGLSHPPDPHLIELLGTVSNHFGSRRLEVISGFRPYSPTQYTSHSNHNIGHAIDFRVVGVPNEILRDYCRTLKNVGVGYYPNSTFVHLDVRALPAFWIDYSRPGEPPRYNAASVDADESTSDVSEEVHGAESVTSPDGPLPAIPPATRPSPSPGFVPSAAPPSPQPPNAPPAPPPVSWSSVAPSAPTAAPSSLQARSLETHP